MAEYPTIQLICGWTPKQFAIAKLYMIMEGGLEVMQNLEGLYQVQSFWLKHRPDDPVVSVDCLSDDAWAGRAWVVAWNECTRMVG